jgi:hypothetical protein
MTKTMWAMAMVLLSVNVQAGVMNPDCTAEKAAKSTAMKATVGVGGRCSPKEAAADTVGLKGKKDSVSDIKGNVDGKVSAAADNLGRKAVKKAVTN